LLRNTLQFTPVPYGFSSHPQDAQKGRPHRPSLVTRRSSLVSARFRILTRYDSRFTDLENAAGGLFPQPASRGTSTAAPWNLPTNVVDLSFLVP